MLVCHSMSGLVAKALLAEKVFQLFKDTRDHDSGNSQHSGCSNEQTHTGFQFPH